MDTDVDSVDIETRAVHRSDERQELPLANPRAPSRARLRRFTMDGSSAARLRAARSSTRGLAPRLVRQKHNALVAPETMAAHTCFVELVHFQESVLHLIDRDLLCLHLSARSAGVAGRPGRLPSRESPRTATSGAQPHEPDSHSTWGKKPMSAIRSPRDNEGRDLAEPDRLRSARSMSRPGVATTISRLG